MHDDNESRNANPFSANLEKLKDLFPDAWFEGKVDFSVLRQILGDRVEGDDEKYGLHWHGKRQARQLALSPSTGTLRPCPEESVDWEETGNLIIEGDNLEVLKLLQKSLANKVKLIYIDPPYNTGRDFVYPDNFRDNIKNYLELTGQVEGGKKIGSNTDSNGRFHTDWLNMMYPRLKLARSLMSDDGFIFISIDDNEHNHLVDMCKEIFGHENFVGTVTRNTGTSTGGGSQILVNIVDYIVICSKSPESGLQGLAHTEEEAKIYDQEDGDGRYLTRSLRRTGGEHRREDRPSMYYPIKGPDGVDVYPIGPGGYESRWVCGQKKYEEHVRDGLIEWKQIAEGERLVWKPYQKTYLEGRKKQPSNLWTDLPGNKKASRDITAMFGDRVFDAPKPIELIASCIGMACDEDSIILDFFAGSGTTGHAVIAQNAADGGRRRFVLIQLPEPLDAENKDQKLAAQCCDKLGKVRNIAELTKERLRRAAKEVQRKNPEYKGDLGFRVFKLAASNIQAWQPKRDDLAETLEAAIDHLKTDRTEADILYELLLKLGLDLCVPLEEKRVKAGTKTEHILHAIGGGVLMACLSPRIAQGEVETLAMSVVKWHEELKPAGETTVVFRDNAFADDVAKTNLTAILEQNGLENVRSL